MKYSPEYLKTIAITHKQYCDYQNIFSKSSIDKLSPIYALNDSNQSDHELNLAFQSAEEENEFYIKQIQELLNENQKLIDENQKLREELSAYKSFKILDHSRIPEESASSINSDSEKSLKIAFSEPELISKEIQTEYKKTKNYWTAISLLLSSASLALVFFFPAIALYTASAFAVLAVSTFINEFYKPRNYSLTV